MVILAAGFAAVALLLTGRWGLHRYDALGRARAFPYTSVVLLCALAIAVASPVYLRHREERRLATAASTLVGAQVTVHCETFGQTFTHLDADLGFVKYGADGVPEHHTQIERDACKDLRRYLRGDQQHPTGDEVIAVHVLTHESMHMRGQTSEAEAECEAMQRDTRTAQLLGATHSAAVELARRYWLTVYPHMPDGYTSSDCGPGGALDEHLPDPPWQATAPEQLTPDRS